MRKSFRSDNLDRGLLLPPSLHDWLPEKYLARFIADVVEGLDLVAIYGPDEGDGGVRRHISRRTDPSRLLRRYAGRMDAAVINIRTFDLGVMQL